MAISLDDLSLAVLTIFAVCTLAYVVGIAALLTCAVGTLSIEAVLYTVALEASVICTLAMAADVINAFRLKKPWFPSTFSSLNVFSLTLLALATMLPLYLNTDAFARHTGLIFLMTGLVNSMTSLASLNDGANIVALVIFVVTAAGYVCVQLIKLRSFVDFCIHLLALILLTAMVSLAVAAPKIKKMLEREYEARLKVMERGERLRMDDMVKYLVMVETSSPQFVMGGSVVYFSAALAFLLAAIVYAAVTIIEAYTIHEYPQKGDSQYGHFTVWISYIHCIGVVAGGIAPAFRWLRCVRFKCEMRDHFRTEFKIEDYWNPLEWRMGIIDIKHFFIEIHLLVVLLSKVLLFLIAVLMAPFFKSEKESKDDRIWTLSSYVVQLDRKGELPRSVLKDICCQADQLIQKGRKMRPLALPNLLQKSEDFNGVGQFDINQYTCLHQHEPPNCWKLPVVTLTIIAVALPNIEKTRVEQLMESVRESLLLTELVEETLVKDFKLANIRLAAGTCWATLVFHKRWMEINLKKLAGNDRASREVLEQLSVEAQAIITKFKDEGKYKMENSWMWPSRVLAANSMYRISRTILFLSETENEVTGEGLFERISIMIADILAACLTNLPRVMNAMCNVERRQERVRDALVLLGKTEEIDENLQKRELPLLNHDEGVSIEEWRASFQQRESNGLILKS